MPHVEPTTEAMKLGLRSEPDFLARTSSRILLAKSSGSFKVLIPSKYTEETWRLIYSEPRTQVCGGTEIRHRLAETRRS